MHDEQQLESERIMNFAKNLLGKYGWKEGDGLGRNSDGITKPLKANYKFDNTGFGHNQADEMNNHWWENVYNEAAANLNVQSNESNVQVGTNSKSVEISTKDYSLKKQKNVKNSNYGGSFFKSSTLTSEGREIEVANKHVISPLILKIVSDEELFKACGGRTAHKGARHGLKLSGKLNRIEEQEKELIHKMKSTTDSSQVFKDYVDCKSRLNARKLKRLNRRKSKQLRRNERKINELASAFTISTSISGEENKVEKIQEVKEEDKEEKNVRNMGKEEKVQRTKPLKLKIVHGRIEKKEKRKNKLKKMKKKFHVKESRDDFLKKMAFEEVAISLDKKSDKRHSIDHDNISLNSYRDQDEHSQSDNEIHRNVFNQLSEKLNIVKKKKQKIIVENLTEFQMEHLRNAHVPFVEVKQSSRKKKKSDKAKFNSLANSLVNKMNIS